MDETRENINEPGEDKARAELKPHEDPVVPLNTKPVPIIIVLTAAAISCVLSIVQGAPFGEFVFRMFRTILVFAVLGTLIKLVLDLIFNKKVPEPVVAETEEEARPDGENIDTESDGSGDLMDEEESGIGIDEDEEDY